jgi:DNA-binding phage protein
MSSELLTPYDPAKYLIDDEDIEVFLADAEGTGDTDYIARARQVAERARAMNQARNEACTDSGYADLSKNQRGA